MDDKWYHFDSSGAMETEGI
ncbi:hypothetical protein ACUH7Y_05495 [Clostridium beijerinckii]